MTTQSGRHPENVESIAAATPLQQGLLSYSLREGGRDPYHYQIVFSLVGELDVDALAHAWQRAVDKHQILRAEYRWEESVVPLQVIYKRCDVSIERRDWRALDELAQRRQLDAWLADQRAVPFDFRRAADIKLRLIQLSERANWLVWSYHHVALDGWSTALVMRDVLNAYQLSCEGSVPQADVAAASYSDYMAWIHTRDARASLEYWRRQLSAAHVPTPLPCSSGVRMFGYSELQQRLSVAETQVLQAGAQALGVTLNTLVQGAWSILLARWADASEVVFGATVSGRSAELPGIEAMAGLFVNTLPIRVRLTPASTVQCWLHELQRQNAESRLHEFTPLAQIQAARGGNAHEPLFESAIVFENYPVDEVLRQQSGRIHVQRLGLPLIDSSGELRTSGRNHYPLSLIIGVTDMLGLTLAYRCDQFSRERVEQLASHLRHLLRVLCEQPQRAVGDVGLPIDTEPSWASSAAEPGHWLQLVAEHAIRTPHALALRDDRGTCTYQQLMAASTQVASWLRTGGVGPEQVVGLWGERSLSFVIGLCGILRAGAAYVPFDPKLPAARVAELLRAAGARWLLTTQPVDFGELGGAQVVALDALLSERDDIRPFDDVPSHASQAAYVIYTSGSTGTPKGVVVSHGALSEYVSGLLARLAFAPNASFALASTVGADLGHTMLFGALVAGRTLHLLPEQSAFDPDAFAAFMRERSVGVLKIAPSHLRALLSASEPAEVLPAEALLLGGEACDWALVERVRRYKPGCRVINHYGPTETTVGVASYEPGSAADSGSVPIGYALPGAALYTLDRDLNRLPGGVDAELYIGGSRLARGYLHSPGATAERFVPDPLGPSGARMYRSGDRVRRRAYGELEFLGRIDRQLKLRGFRVEPAELETALSAHPALCEASALVHEVEGTPQLLAFAVSASGDDVDVQALRAWLNERLPDYLVPSRIVMVLALPLNPNGKLDRAALLKALQNVPTTPSVAPADALEAQLLDVWKEVLQRAAIGVTDNFFEIGGDSIRSLQLVARARRRGLKLTPRLIFSQPTIRQLASAITIAAEPESPEKQPAAAPDVRLTLSADQRSELGDRARDVVAAVPLSPIQQGIMLHVQTSQRADAYVNQLSLEVQGLELSRFRLAWQTVIERHESLRTGIHTPWGLQVVYRSATFRCEERDLRTGPCSSEQLRAIADAEHKQLFDLSQPPLQRVLVLHLPLGRQRIVWTYHHVLCDGWSSALQLDEVLQCYLGEALPQPRSQYRDYLAWLARQERGTSEHFWRAQLAPLEQPTLLASRRGGPGRGHHSRRGELTPEQTTKLIALAQTERVTLNTLVQAAWALLLQRYVGAATVAFGVTVSGRPPELEEVERALGPFIHTLPMVQSPRPAQRLGAYLRELQQCNLSMREHEHLPLHEIQRLSNAVAGPLFDTLVAYQNFPVDDPLRERGRDQLQIRDVEVRTPTGYTLTLQAACTDRLTFRLGAWRESFGPAALRDVSEQLQQILLAFVDRAVTPLGDLPLASAGDWAVLARRNETRSVLDAPDLAGQIARVALHLPDAIAVTFANTHLSYRTLDRRANQLAAWLRAQGVGPEVSVGVCLERGLALPVALYAVLKAGGVYVPLDPDYPSERRQFMAADSGVRLVLTQQTLRESLRGIAASVVCLDDVELTLEAWPPSEDVHTQMDPLQAAFCIYTSGSTGKPKGAINTHGGLRNCFAWLQRAFPLTSQDRVLQKTPIGFDVSVPEMLWTLMNGAQLVMAAPGAHRDPHALWDVMTRHAITTANFVPSLLQAFLTAVGGTRRLPQLRVFSAGEPLSLELQTQYFRRCGGELHNLYGPTETSLYPLHWSCSVATASETVPIGRVTDNIAIYVLDAWLNPVPADVVGELYIAGAGVGRGYRGRAGLTAERFVADPFASEPGSRMYRSGDLARARDDGALEYVGRRDDQVKIRGNRIELSEIESRLREYAEVREAVVLARDAAAGNGKLLLGCIVPNSEPSDAAVLMPALRAHLRQTLPEYMVPTQWQLWEALPTTPNGKLDRRALLAAPTASTDVNVLPSSPVALALAEIWRDVLGLGELDLHQDFFEVGGHSLAAAQVAARIADKFALSVGLPVLFEQRTLAQLAGYLERALAAGLGPTRAPAPAPLRSRPALAPLSAAQRRLWFLWQIDPHASVYNLNCAVRLKGSLNRAALRTALDGLVERHEALRTRFVLGPDAETLQQVDPAAPLPLAISDLGELSEREERAAELLASEAREPFDLLTGPVLRARLIVLAQREHILIVTMHHIVSDGWSLRIIIEEFAALYAAAHQGALPQLPVLPRQYADYALWQNTWLTSEREEEQLAYWRAQLRRPYPLLSFAGDTARAGLSFGGSQVRFELSVPLTAQIMRFAREQAVTPFVVLLGAFSIVAAERTGSSRFRLGTDSANRSRVEFERVVGFFINQLVLDIDVLTDQSVGLWLRHLREVVANAVDHQELPYDRLVAALAPERRSGKSPFFSVKFLYREQFSASYTLPDLQLEPISVQPSGAELDLVVEFEAVGERLVGKLKYNVALFERETLQLLAEQLSCVVSAMVEQPAAAVRQLGALVQTLAERQNLQRERSAAAHAGERAAQLRRLHPLPRGGARRGVVSLTEGAKDGEADE